jgi:tetratricopeptide (TPR) repeat protein
MKFIVLAKSFTNKKFRFNGNVRCRRISVYLFLSLSFLLSFGCQGAPKLIEHNRLEAAQEKIIKKDYDGARNILTKFYENSKLKTEKGEALYWIAYTHIKESSYSDALNYLENADKLYRSGNLLGAISARIIACALLDSNETRALKQYEYIQDKKVGEMPEINFIMGKYFQKKGDLANAKSYFLKCRSSGDNLFARRAGYSLNYVAEGVFYLQIGAYSNSVNANKVSQKIMSDYSLETYIKESVINNNKLFVICYGKFNTRQEADKELNNLKNKFKDLDLVIRP